LGAITFFQVFGQFKVKKAFVKKIIRFPKLIDQLMNSILIYDHDDDLWCRRQ